MSRNIPARTEGMKTCPLCEVEKSVGEFSPNSQKFDGLAHGCRPCRATYEKMRRKQKTTEEHQAARRLRMYGMTEDDFAELLDSQFGRCAVCATEDPGGRGWCVDHDHSCCAYGKNTCGDCVRGILCGNCNTAAGLLGDSEATVLALFCYLSMAPSPALVESEQDDYAGFVDTSSVEVDEPLPETDLTGFLAEIDESVRRLARDNGGGGSGRGPIRAAKEALAGSTAGVTQWGIAAGSECILSAMDADIILAHLERAGLKVVFAEDGA